MGKCVIVICAVLAGAAAWAADRGVATSRETKVNIACSFAKGKWKAADWLQVRRPDWDCYGSFRQRDGFIENEVPAGLTGDQLQASQKTHAGLVLRSPVSGKAVISATMEFAYQMAPSIILLPDLQDSPKKPFKEYRESYEVVLWNQGINVWHMTMVDKKAQWDLVAYEKFSLKAKTKYKLKVSRDGDTLEINVGDHTFGFRTPSLPQELHVGVAACEGLNRFYDFKVKQ